LRPGESIEGRRFEVGPEAQSRPPVLLTAHKPGRGSRGGASASDYALKLAFDRAEAGRVSGRIYLCVADEAQSYLAGVFVLESNPGDPSKGPPGPQDVPYVRGSIRLDKPAKGVLEVGYVGQPEQGETVADSASGPFASGASASSVAFAPRTTRLDAGPDGAEWVCRRLPPGRYLFYACWNGRAAAAWRWLDVLDGARQTVDFTLTPEKTGSLEVRAPAPAGEVVRLIPLDEKGRFPALPFAPALLARCLKMEASLKSGAARLDRLPEGAYRVLVGDARGAVAIRAGAVSRLDLTIAE
jgi:hypothetical protein